jgi:hypothetical protein
MLIGTMGREHRRRFLRDPDARITGCTEDDAVAVEQSGAEYLSAISAARRRLASLTRQAQRESSARMLPRRGCGPKTVTYLPHTIE